MNPIIDAINAAMPEVPRLPIVGILVRPQAYDKICGLIRDIEDAYPFAIVYAPLPYVVTHPR